MSGILTNMWLKSTATLGRSNVRPLLVCADGFSMSVQASASHYCEPRTSDADWYDTVEVYRCSWREPLFDDLPGRDDSEDEPYARVPVSLVDTVILKHGDIV